MAVDLGDTLDLRWNVDGKVCRVWLAIRKNLNFPPNFFEFQKTVRISNFLIQVLKEILSYN